ncbi:AAA family ATPase [Mediterraneibacter gnavus]|uniref:AAA family ATPase n=1 Tax=Mediterraneibacter gnavus TaxID=33038 RepID=UPI00232E866A|nr:AAA family ATPase [Mediterraneibacter gnavus]MDB8711979.1 AAA family ATPase [Mediterraneibacter gnavus]MDB8715000.1 AAA family ATPase [Mediterraneibacter gnavus]
MFYIKKISLLTGINVVSELDLEPGLNIIYGESNTGKSLIVDCIDYMFGATEHRFDTKLQLKQITLVMDVDGENLTMRREIDSNDFEVSSSVNYIDSDTYKTGNAKKCINAVWLRLMGIEDEVKIIQTLGGKPQRLTMRTFYHILLIDEQRVQAVSSVLASGIGFNKKVGIPVMSSLLYFATKNNYLPEKIGKDKKTKNERKDAVKKFVDRSMSKLAERKVIELQNFSKYTPGELQKKVDSVIDEIGAAEGALEDAINRSREIADNIIAIDNQIAESRVLRNRNLSLLSQYESDIRRLTFIVDGDIHSDSILKLEHCPFCNGELPKDKSESCIDAAIAEVEKIEAQIKDLQSVQDAISAEVEELNETRISLMSERRQVDSMIRGELRPQILQLRSHLADYTMALNQYKAKEMIEAFSDVLVGELKVTEEEESSTLQVNVPGKFNDTFRDKLDRILKNLLETCNYQRFAGVRFDADDYDVVVNGHLKKSQGKGFRAFLNTILAIAIQVCLDEYNVYKPQLLVVDSPILSLKEKEDHVGEEHTSETMKSGLFKYLLQHQDTRQTIIIENEIPDLDYESANLIEFTKDEKKGRYGLITGYRD